VRLTSILILTLGTAGSALAAGGAPPPDFVWVSSTGTFNSGCLRFEPCDTFVTALAAASADGLIKAVDAANYGPVTIMKNVTIEGNGAGIEAGAGTGITINNSGGQVRISDLTIRVAAGGTGIRITGGDVHLENVRIVGNPAYGVYADGTGSPVHVTTKNVTVTNAGNGGILLYGASGSIRDSVVRGGNYGIYVESAPGQAAVALVERCEISYNTLTGLTANNAGGPGAAVRVSDTVITGNATGISTVAGGQIITLRTNILTGNTTDGSTPFSISLK
jgi:hypothetical protein